MTDIFAQCPDSGGLGLAVGNRLKKAAGFHVENADDGRKVVGITGGTGAGKTTLLTALASRGACVLDCDAVYHEMLRDDEPLRTALRDAFGGGIFDESGAIVLHRIGEVVFHDAEKLKELDGIVHVHLPRALSQRMAETDADVIVLDAIKLFESGLGALCSVTVAVTAPAELRVRRIMARDGISGEYARARIAAQKSDDYYLSLSDMAFVNDGEDAKAFFPRAQAFADKIIDHLKEDK